MKRKNLDLTENCIKMLELEAKLIKEYPDNCFKLHAESILEAYAKDITDKKRS